MDLERQVINFRRVYGDFDTTAADTEAMTQAIEQQAISFAKWGITVRDSIELAASAAATGLTGDDLLNVTEQATKLATLGMITQEQALDTMISLNSAFQISGQELEDTVNFLNAVENQTVLALSDVTEAIPLVAPVIKGLGGDVQDLAVMLTAMREGGIGANEAANALKTSLARLVTPAKAARDRAEELGINLKALVEDNQGDLMGMINDLARAMQGLSDLQKQQLLSDLFGKRQFARMGALFSNIADEASQAQRVIDLTTASTAELAQLADKELSAIEESTGMRFTKAMEQLKVAIAPIGEAFLKILTPIIEFGTKAANWFNSLEDGAKNLITVLVAVGGAVVPVAVMLTGLALNFASFFVKAVATLQGFFARVQTGATSMEYLSQEQMEAALAAEQLSAAENNVTAALNAQAQAVANLGKQYVALAGQRGGSTGGTPPIKMATGGNVPGAGNTDKIPALLTPGEFVVKKDQANKHRGFLTALNSGMVKGFSEGTAKVVSGTALVRSTGITATDIQTNDFQKMIDRLTASGFEASGMLDYLEGKLKSAAAQGETLSQVISDVKQEIPGFASHGDRTEKSHVVDPIARGSDAVKVIERRGVQKSNTGVLELLQALERLGPEALDSALDVEVLGNAVSDLPKSINQATKDDGITNAGFVQSQFTTAQRANPSKLFDRMQGQLMSLGMSVEEANMAADQMGTEFLQMVDALPEDTIVVESEQLAQEMREAREAAGQTGPEIVSINKMMEQASQKVSNNVAGFGDNWKILKEEAGAFRIKWKKITDKLLAQLEAQGVYLTPSRGRDGKAYTIATDTTKAKGIKPKTVKSADTLHFSGGKATKYTERNSETQQKAIEAETIRRANELGAKSQEAFNEGKESANGPEDDSWVQSQDEAARNSPHPGATQDGTDDGNAYVEAKRAAIEGGGKGAKGGLAGSSNKSNQRLAALQNQRVKTTQQVVVADQQVVAASRRQVVAQNAMTTATNTAAAAMTTVGASAKRFGAMLMQGSMKMTGVLGGLSGAVFALSMFEGPMQEMSQKAMPVVMGLTSLQMILPLLKNPWIALIAAVAALGGGLWYLTKLSKDAINASKEYANALYGSTEELEGFAKFTGNITNASKDLQRKIEEAGTKLDEEKLSEASSYLESDPGKKFLEDIEKVVDTDGTDRAAQAVVDKLTRGVLSGALSADLAKAISVEVGSALGNQSLGIDATAEITRILGPDGEPDIDGRLQLYADIQGRIVNVDESLNSANKLWSDTGTLGKIGMTISGVGESDLASGLAAGKYAEAATINAEAQAAFNQAIVDGEIGAESYNEVLSNLYATELTGAEYFNKTKEAIDQKFGKGTFDQNEYNAFLKSLKDSTERVFVMSDAKGAGGEAGKDYFEAFFGAADAIEPIDLSTYDNTVVRGSIDTSDYEEMVKMMESQRDIAENTALNSDTRRNARLQVERLEKDIEDYINMTSALQDGSFEIIDGETFNSAMDRFKRINAELSNLDRWLQSEIDPNSTLYSKLFGANASDGSRQGSEALEALKERVGEAQVAAMQAGVQIESIFEMLDGDIEKSIAYLEDYAFIQSEAFDELSKKEKKEFLLEMVTDTGLFDEELMREFKGLDPYLQKEWILNITTRYSEIGKRPTGVSEYAWNAMSNEEQKKWFAESQKPQEDGPNPADKPTGTDGGGGGGKKELDWLQQLEKDTKESKELYGKIIKAEKEKNGLKQGWVDWLRKNSNLSEEAIQELAKDEKARKKYYNMSETEQAKVDRKSNNNDLRKLKSDTAAEAAKKQDELNVTQREGNTLIAKTIKENEALMRLYDDRGKSDKQAQKDREKAKKIAQDIVNVEMTLSEQRKWQNQQLEKQEQLLMKNLQVVKMQSEAAAESAAEAVVGKSQEAMQEQNVTLQAEADYIRKSQIGPIEDKIKAQQKIIDGIEREAELLERGLKVYDDQLEAKQKQVEEMQRADELMMRESQMLDHDLKLMGYQEEAINKTYEERIASLDKVAQLNQQIAEQQRNQLGLADALSRGDVSAAAAAAQQMQQSQMQYAADQFRSQLETSRDSQISSLTGAESGMTRDQIDLRQRELEEASYQTSLRIRAIEDEIYNIEQLRAGKQAEINALLDTTQQYEDEIFNLEVQILNIEEGRLAEIEKIVAKNEEELAFINWKTLAASEQHRVAIAQETERQAMAKATRDLDVLALEMQESLGQSIEDNIRLMNAFGTAAARANQAVKTGKYTSVGAKNAAMTKVIEDYTNRIASVPANITATGKAPTFSVPTSAVTSGAVGGIMGNITNNYNNSNVNVMAQGADANQVADIVIQKLEARKNSNVGGL